MCVYVCVYVCVCVCAHVCLVSTEVHLSIPKSIFLPSHSLSSPPSLSPSLFCTLLHSLPLLPPLEPIVPQISTSTPTGSSTSDDVAIRSPGSSAHHKSGSKSPQRLFSHPEVKDDSSSVSPKPVRGPCLSSCFSTFVVSFVSVCSLIFYCSFPLLSVCLYHFLSLFLSRNPVFCTVPAT